MTNKKHGGRRSGAGPKLKHGEKLKNIGVPESWLSGIQRLLEQHILTRAKRGLKHDGDGPSIRHSLEIPLFTDRIEAGAPAHADGEIEDYIDINDYLGTQDGTDYLLSVSGFSMVDAGILPGDILSVKKSKHPKDGDIVIAAVDDGLTVKRYVINGEGFMLKSENKAQPNFSENVYSEIAIIGIVGGVVRKL